MAFPFTSILIIADDIIPTWYWEVIAYGVVYKTVILKFLWLIRAGVRLIWVDRKHQIHRNPQSRVLWSVRLFRIKNPEDCSGHRILPD